MQPPSSRTTRGNRAAAPARRTPALVLLAMVGLAACDDPPKPPATEAAAPALAEARRAAEEQVRTRLRIIGDMRLRAIQVYSQQVPDTVAVCGQVNPAGGANDPFVPWVAMVTLKDGKAVRTDLVLGASNMEASRVYIESVDRCFEGGGPRNAPGQSTRALPPLPADAGLSQAAPPAPPPAMSPSVALPLAPPRAAGSITTTAAHPVNIRNAPAGGGAVVRIVARSSALRVFGDAPGGWLQVGEDQPFGWLHESMLER